MAHTQILPAPLRLPADVQRDACITSAAGYFADREDILEIAHVATTDPNALGRTEIEQLGAAVETLDTLLVGRDVERSANLRTIATLQQQLEVSNGLGAKAHRELLAERDRAQALTLELEGVRSELADVTSMVATHLAESFRMHALAASLSKQLAVANHAAMEAAYELDIARAADIEHDRAQQCEDRRLTWGQRARARTVRITQRTAIVAAYRSTSMVFDVSDTDIVDEPVVGREQTIRIPEACVDFGGAA